ncbi:MAG: site-specific DNA-methyltransferase [Desulfamplus sp.]|nr:site-specific DNA-methyltransferase [Desulfamplus sp.]
MSTKHNILFSDSRNLSNIEDATVDLIVTSPPYPMIEMWDDLFRELNPNISDSLDKEDGQKSFELMNIELDKVWSEVDRILNPNGFVCINIGDATRTIGGQFQLYSNHSRITSYFIKAGYQPLPIALWKKSTNAPNKFMGSGMLPAGAYITLEHEYILVFRKGGKRVFKTPSQKALRNSSAFFWEERNQWFSDTWNLKGVRQTINGSKTRERNAAFPFELPYRLINMYSVKGDTVFDPFLGTGTTSFAAIATERNSIGVEYDHNFDGLIKQGLVNLKLETNELISSRIKNHIAFTKEYEKTKRKLKHKNSKYGFPVMTRQEAELSINYVSDIDYSKFPEISVKYENVEYTYSSNEMLIIKNENQMRDEVQLSLFD